MRRALLALMVLAGLAGTASAATNYYISTTGSDSNPCSLAEPCLTIAHAQTVVQAYIAAHQPLYHFVITPTANSNNDLFYDLSLAPAGFWSRVRSDGGDIRVTAQDGTTQLPREVSGFDYAGHKGSLFIGMGAATACYIYYGDPSATEPAPGDTYGKYNAWPASAQAIHHMEDLTDSSGKGNNLSGATTATVANAKIGKGYTLVGSGSSYLTAGDIDALDGIQKLTVLVWIYAGTWGGDRTIAAKWTYATQGNFGFQTQTGLPRYLSAYIATSLTDIGDGCQVNGTQPVLTDGQWARVGFVFDGTKTGDANRLKMYCNGQPIAMATSAGAVPSALTSGGTAPFNLGYFGGALARYFKDQMDEGYVFTDALTDAQVATDYANQNSPATFWTTGSEVPTGAGPGTINVYLRGGTYTQAAGLSFGAPDSGTAGNPITWLAYPGEVPVISGGQEITGWSAATGVQNYYFTITPTTNSNADLYYDLSLAPAGFWAHVRSDGGDIRVMKQDNVMQVAREVSAFNAAAHTGALYISTASGTATSYYVYYGMPSATEPAANATYGKYGAWASSAEAVWHLEDATDSTVHQHSGVPPTVADPVTAKLLKGQNFSLSTPSDYVVTDDMTALHGATAMTAMAWIKQTTVTTNMGIVCKWDYSTQGTFALQTGAFSANELTAFIATSPTDDGSGCRVDTTGAGLTNGQWAHVAWVFDGSLTGDANRLKVYVNGSPVTVSQGSGHVPAALTSATAKVRIGMFGGSLYRFFAGTIDDARIYTRAFTATEIATMYTNQNAPGTFWTTGAETATTVQGLFRATVGTDWDFRQLYVNGVHAERAHGNAFPSGWTITAGGFTAPDSSMALWGNLTDAEICAHGSWSMACCKVASVDGPSITMQTPCHTNVWTLPAGLNFVPWFVGNAYELLAAGYWYLNRTTGVLYYMPPGGTMSGLTVVAPVATQLLTVTGAHNITFDKLSFAYSNWTDPDSGTGYVGWQAGNYWTGAGTLNYLTDPRMQTGAIAIAGSQHISLTNSQVAHMGSRAVTVLGGSQNIVLANNTFTDNASGAIQAGTSLLADCPGTQESAVTITGNLINSGNTFDYVDSGGIVAPCVTASTISNNEIHGTYSMPITIGWGWGYQGAAYSTNNAVADNFIDTFCIFTDCGGIYSNGSQSATGAYLTGLKVTGNFLRHGTMSIGALYGDNASTWATWTGNVTQNTSSGYWAFAQGDAHDMTFTGNYNDNALTLNLGTNVTITSNTTISSGTQPFGTPQQAIICSAGIPGATACTTPTLWPTWQSGVGATWSRPQIGP